MLEIDENILNEMSEDAWEKGHILRFTEREYLFTIKVAAKMLLDSMPIEKIKKYTEISDHEIEKIKTAINLKS